MKSRFFSTLTVFALALGLAGAVPAVAQPTFSLDDDPSTSVVAPVWTPNRSAEDPYGFGFVQTLGVVGPSPTLFTGGFFDSDFLNPGPAIDVRTAPGAPVIGGLWYVDALSGDHEAFSPGQWPQVRLRFSVDRVTGGVAGSASRAQFASNQQPGDIFATTLLFSHPCNFNGNLGWGPFAGFLPTAGAGGSNILIYNQSGFGLVPAVGPGVVAGAIGNGTHDNVDAFNELPGKLDVTGDLITDRFLFYSVAPADAARLVVSPADVFAAPPGGVNYPTAFPFAGAPALGLDQMGGFDDLDALVLWDFDAPLGGVQPAIDCAIFSLSSGSPSLAALQAAGVAVDPGTIFFTDFTGAFAVYATSNDLGLRSPAGQRWVNVDALEIAQD